jgi:hypothetical protein
LTGGGAGTYDARPAYNIANFNPNGSTSSEGPVTALNPDLETVHNDLSVVGCNQDLRQDFVLHLTKAQFTVWSENENSFTGSYECIDSVQIIPFLVNPTLVARSNFDESRYDSQRPVPGARHCKRSMPDYVPTDDAPASDTSPPTENAGLVGVLTSTIGVQDTLWPIDATKVHADAGFDARPGLVMA